MLIYQRVFGLKNTWTYCTKLDAMFFGLYYGWYTVEIDMYSVYIYMCTHLTQKCFIHCGNCNVCFFCI
jgi:hypothetical protein